MKHIVKTILPFVAFFAFVPGLFAQSDEPTGQVIPDDYHDLGGLTYSKIVQGPNDNGEYFIYLKSFVTGEVTVQTGTAPADIVLVLDYSTSMKSYGTDGQTLLSHLQTAVAGFVSQIKTSNSNVIQDSKGGHRLAFVLYGSSVATGAGRNTLYAINSYTVNGSAVYYGNTNVTGWNNNNRGTASGLGMQRARDIIGTEVSSHTYEDTIVDGVEYKNSRRSKIVVWFTDGDPTGTNNGEATEGRNCIVAANTVKNTYKGSVYSIGLFTNMSNPQIANKETTFLSYTSSDYSDEGDATHQTQTQYPSSAPFVSVSEKYSFVTNDPSKLANIFGTISSEAADSDIDLGESTTVVDVVSKSFSIPTGSDASDVQVFETDVTGHDGENYTFSMDEDDWTPLIDADGITLNTDEPNTVSVEGWDFEENMVAENPNTSPKTYRGKQLILKIPIVMNSNAIGGHGVGTNGPGSGIRYVKSDGTQGLLEFETPDINLPINLHIQKRGLNKGESAKFTIQRMWNGSDAERPTGIDADTWYDYTSVFVTRRNETETGDDYPIVKIIGLHPDYLYKIKEEDWSWSYGVSDVYGFNYDPDTADDPDTEADESITRVDMSNGTADDWSDNTVISNKINLNPFIFVNAKKDVESSVVSVRHAESLVRNEFKNASSTTATEGATINSKDYQ